MIRYSIANEFNWEECRSRWLSYRSSFKPICFSWSSKILYSKWRIGKYKIGWSINSDF